MVTAGIYVRISNDRKGAGLGVERQEAACRELADRLGWTVAAVYADNDLSAYSGKPRPAYRALLESVRSGEIEGVITWHNDRLVRRVRDLEELIELAESRHFKIQTVDAGDYNLATPTGRMLARQLVNLAMYEVEHGRNRMRSAKAQAAAAGKWRGGRRPFGYESDGITVRPSEAAALDRAAREIVNGRSLNAIAREMNAAGLRTSGSWAHGCEPPCGKKRATQCPDRTESRKKFNGTNLRRLLQRPRNAGLLEANGEVIGKAQWPAIIPEDIWRAAVATLADPGRRTSTGSERRWLGSGLYACGTCGAGLYVSSGSGRRRAYRCPNSAHVTRDQAAVDEYVRGIISGVLSRPDAADMLREPDDGSTDALRAAQESLRARLAVFEADYAAGDINGRQLADATARVQADLDKVDAELAAKMRGTALGELADAPNPGEAFLAASLDRQRAILDALATVTIHPGRRGRPAGWRPGEPYVDLDSVIVAPRM